MFQRLVDVYGEAQAIVSEAHGDCFVAGRLVGNPYNAGFLQAPARLRAEFDDWKRGVDQWLEDR
ncbi:hypothetical protein D3C83_124170 [compost metagenome]